MKKTKILLLPLFIILIYSSTGYAQKTVQGTIYLDQNKNGTLDTGEQKIPDVAISNGQDVVVTNENGRYQLPIDQETIVFISKPAGYRFPLNKDNLPQFYYIHQPEGSPELKYAGLKPTGQLPEFVNFGLIPSQKKETFTAIAFGDPQPRDNQELSYFRDDVVPELAEIDADLTIPLGDIMFNNLSMYGRYNKIMRTLDRPIFNILGNHDMNLDAKGNRYANETFKRYYGPAYYSFNYGEVHFIALDNIDYSGRDKNGHAQYRGYLSDKELAWIRNDLQYVDEDKLIVFLAHIPLHGTDNKKELIGMLNNRDDVLFLAGHRHLTFQRFFGKDFGRTNSTPIHAVATTAACGTWWGGPKDERGIPITTQRDGVPNGYHIFEFDGNTYKERYKAAGHAENFQMRIESPVSSLKKKELPKNMVVNVFNGSKKSEVRFKIDDHKDWRQMERLENHQSPFFMHLTEKYKSFNRSHSTNHMWSANLPDLEKGIHKITVWTKDMYGQEFTESKIIEVQ